MKSIVFLEAILVCLTIYDRYVKGEFSHDERLNPEKGHSKHTLCAPTTLMSPPSLLAHLPEDGKYIKVICLYNSQFYYTQEFSPDNLSPDLCTHVNYEFAFLDEESHQLVPGDPTLDLQHNFYKKVTGLKEKNPALKVFLSLGGWEDSTEKYSELVKSPKKRADFITNVISFLQNHKFDGLDVAWEYPNAWQGDVGACKDDKPNFAIFLQEVKDAFSEKGLGLSASVSANMNEIEAAYDVAAISKAVDHLNLMTYDLHGHWEGKTGHHTQFNMSESEISTNLISSLQEWVKRGADRRKLVVGVAAYGHSSKLEDPRHHGIGAKVSGPGDPGPITQDMGYMAFNEICYKLENEKGWTVIEDPQAGTYMYRHDQWISFDSLASLSTKVKYVIQNGYGGIAVKDVSSDDYNGCCLKKLKYPVLITIVDKIFEAYFLAKLHG